VWQAIEVAIQNQEWVGELLPTRYFQLEEMLKEEAKKRSPPILTTQTFDTICNSLSIHGKDINYAKVTKMSWFFKSKLTF